MTEFHCYLCVLDNIKPPPPGPWPVLVQLGGTVVCAHHLKEEMARRKKQRDD